MANQTYLSLFQIKMFHTYFERDTVETALQLLPSEPTISLFKNYGFRLHSNKGIFTVYGSYDGSFQDLLNNIETSTSVSHFEFIIDIKDTSFYGYTEIPIKEQYTFLYNSNNNANSGKENGIVLAPRSVPFDTHFGIIKIYFKDIIESVEETPSFNIPFKARATRWEYFIINKSNLDLNILSIETNDDFEFVGPELVMLPNNQAALKFTSGDRLLFLNELRKYNFSLVQILLDGSKEIIFRGLPNANPDTLEFYSEDGITKVSSPMYIYI